MKRFKILAQAMTGTLKDHFITEALFYLQDMQKPSPIQTSMVLVASQFCCVHDTTFTEITDVLINMVSQDVSSESSYLIEACMLGLRNIARKIISTTISVIFNSKIQKIRSHHSNKS
jgi:hypothetical protein